MSNSDKAQWFAGVRKVSDVRGYNPLGHSAALHAPFSASGRLGPGGEYAVPAPGVVYTVTGVDALVSLSAATPVTVTVFAPLDGGGREEVWSGAVASLPPMSVPIGFSVSFGDVEAARGRVRIVGN